jgi:hypothetical protein
LDPNLENQIDESNVLLETLVGEGKKYKTVADLAKAYAHADVHISKVTTEKAELENKVKTMEAQLEILNKLATNQTNTAQSNETPAVETTVAKNPSDEGDIEAKIRSTVEQLGEEQKRAVNTNKVDAVLLERFGEAEKATEFLKTKASELGLGVKFLTDLAASSPTAFFATVGLDTNSQPKSDAAPKSTVNTASVSQMANVRPNTYAWYQQLRKDDKTLYYSAKIQLQMHQDASKPGFFE